MTENQNIVVIYHGNCNDGTMAAAVLLSKLPSAKLFPLTYGYKEEEATEILSHIDEGVLVYTLDSAFLVEESLKKGAKVITLDHHINIKEDMEPLSDKNENYTLIFNNERSGAAITWEYFYPDSPMPRAIELVEDIDLWLRKYGKDSHAFARYLELYRDKPKEVLPLLKELPESILKEGQSVVAYEENLVTDLLEDNEPLSFTVGEHTIPAYNSTFFKTVVGSITSKKHESVVAIFNIKGKEVRLSIRSKDGHNPSALDIAKLLGGGGHKNASGAAISLEEFKKMIS